MRPVFLVRLPDGSERVCNRDEAVVALGNGGHAQAMHPSVKCLKCGREFDARSKNNRICNTCKGHRYGRAAG
jgi:Zn finger protein HypA/HybF involved in hydrogenase expression